MEEDTKQMIVFLIGLIAIIAGAQGCQSNEYAHIQAMERIKQGCPSPASPLESKEEKS